MNPRAVTPLLRIVALAMLAVGLLILPGCSSDSPSEPAPSGGTPPANPGGGTNFSITVTASPATLPAGSSDPALITVRVRQADGSAPAGGTTLVVTTTLGFLGTPGGPNNVPLVLNGGVANVQLFPPVTTAGTAVVQARLQNSVGQAQVVIREQDEFFIGFVSPAVGNPAGGDTVTINGGGFIAPVRVTFGGVNAQVLSVSGTRIRVRTPTSSSPSNQQNLVNVTVTNNVNGPDQATDTISGGFTYSPGGGETEIPTAFSVTPATGPNEGGTLLTIVGSGFEAPLQVLFGQGTDPGTFQGQEGEIRSITPTRLEVLTPAATGFGQNNQNASVDILFRNLDTGLASIATSVFRYGSEVLITSMGPGTSPYFGGVLVTIFGQGFDAPVAVELANFAQSVRSVTGTEIVVETVPIVTDSCDDVSGGVEVVNIETGDSATSGITFTYLVELFGPLVSSLSPTSGPQAGGTTVTVRGSNLRDAFVTFDGRPAAITSVSSDFSTLVIRTPFLPEESFLVAACDDNNDGTEGERFVPTAVNMTVVNRATTCDFDFPDAFVYAPSNSTCRGDTAPPPPPPPPGS
ncbi:MAG: IPT/TIG domain-containing protein [Acidobacteriota bacterium]